MEGLPVAMRSRDVIGLARGVLVSHFARITRSDYRRGIRSTPTPSSPACADRDVAGCFVSV